MNPQVKKLIDDARVWAKRRNPHKEIEALEGAIVALGEGDSYLKTDIESRIERLRAWDKKIQDGSHLFECEICGNVFNYNELSKTHGGDICMACGLGEEEVKYAERELDSSIDWWWEMNKDGGIADQ